MIKLGIIGLARSGRSTVFRALTASSQDGEYLRGRDSDQIGVVFVPDERVDLLTGMYHPQKKDVCPGRVSSSSPTNVDRTPCQRAGDVEAGQAL